MNRLFVHVMMDSNYPSDMGAEHSLYRIVDAGLDDEDFDNMLVPAAQEHLELDHLFHELREKNNRA
ncbi:MAG: hypothetical protein FJY54_17935 [Betaproteobacteria bacterium]|nr:hypothetical protein [Betaproteobacteria bacterium]